MTPPWVARSFLPPVTDSLPLARGVGWRPVGLRMSVMRERGPSAGLWSFLFIPHQLHLLLLGLPVVLLRVRYPASVPGLSSDA